MNENLSWRKQPKTLKLHDPASGFIHFVGALLSVAALVLLVTTAGLLGKPWHIVSFAISGAGMIGLYSASTICHWFQKPDCPKQWMEKLDHCMIYLLIASTYTPICLIPLRGPAGWSLFGIVWGFGLLGMVLKVFFFHTPDWITSSIYIIMGWSWLLLVRTVTDSLTGDALVWLYIGGGLYTLAGIVYALRAPEIIKDVFSHHEIFHLLIIAGSFSFFWLMYAHLMPMN